MLPTPAVNQVDLSFFEHQHELELARQRAIVKARQYHYGHHPTFLTERLRQFLNVNGDMRFRTNICKVVVDAVTERLLVAGFRCADAVQAAWLQRCWQAARMDAKQNDVHESAVRDGEAFVIVDWDPANQRPRFTPHERYTSTDVDGGDGQGCRAIYANGDPNQPLLYVGKQWVETIEKKPRQRLTLYYPDRIEKYVWDGEFRPYRDPADGDRWPLPWLDGLGQPLGIPVAHFRNPGDECEAWEAIPAQDAANKTLIDLLAAADTAGFGIYVALGFVPTTDGMPLKSDLSNALDIEPGTTVATTAKDADFKAIQASNLTPLLDLKNALALDAAIVTRTPTARFTVTRQVAAENTLKQQEEPLLSKIRLRHALFGNGWEDAMSIARRLQNVLGGGVEGKPLDESAMIATQWASAQARSDKERQEEWKAKRDGGVPEEQIFTEMGYTAEEIATFAEMPSYKARMALLQAGLDAGNG